MTTTGEPTADRTPGHRPAPHGAEPGGPGPGHPEPERELLPTATGARTRAAVRELLRPHRPLAAGAFSVLAGATAAGLLTAPLLGRVVDSVAEGRPVDALTLPVLLLAAVAVAQGAATALGVGLVARLGEGVLATLRERFVERALRLPLEQVERAGSGDLTSRVTGDVSTVAEAVRGALPELARSVLTIGLTLVGLAVLDWRFLLAALLAVPIQLHTVRWYVRRAVPLYAEQRVAVGAQQQQLLDTIGGARTVRAFRLAEQHTERVTRRSRAAVELALRGIRLLTGFYGRLNLAEYVGLAAVLATGFVLVRADSVSVGTATAAALYFHSLFGPINVALALVDDALLATASLSRLVGVAELPLPHEPRRPALPADASIKVAGVHHAYQPGHPVLRDVDLAVTPGERVALVGASGAGKTTLAKLIAGIHTPSAGTVSLGGVDLADLGPAAVRRTVVLVTQEVHVFAGPLADDLRLARPDATDEDLRTALDRVGALDWARALPDGLDTVVGEGAHRLTVTQAQQLALARLVLADPPVAILDEATAEAGSAGARVLETAAARALEGRTGLVVAHRLTQAATADRVVVMEAGRIVESGSHAELVAAGGRYAALWEAWADEHSDGEDGAGEDGGGEEQAGGKPS
ncbi:ABC transporter ATP-binding protein [Allostreptomyces psammosilenae]|uniref:ATP-binding cassette subfamily C protein n=1 Tax=Allostreptomyces psammosilenae TaxID=1892865 RepID=A0A852ZPJ3_9ACTN|nr:ABC transporter ATP-binding protein [Allostreptomyces psammosilenae]NYI04366.1 ATP-binding cassette subfamily C protein [Allostreptomyces psammosilenae]